MKQSTTFFNIFAPITILLTLIILTIPTGVCGQSSSSVTLTWTASGDDGSTGTASYYDIRYSTSLITVANWDNATQVDNEPTPQTSGSQESITVDNLQPSTTYYFALKVADEDFNWSPLSNVISKATGVETTAPGLVVDLGTYNPTQTSISLNWTAPGDDGNSGSASQYDIRYSTAPITNGNFFSATPVTGEPVPQAAGSTESMTVNGLNQNTTYYFALRSADEVPNWSGVSNSTLGSTSNESTPPANISNLVASNPSDTSVILTWTAPGDDGSNGTAFQYEIRYSTSVITASNWNSATAVGSVPTPQAAGSFESFEVTGLSQEETYYFVVRTSDEVPNWSAISNAVSTTTIDMTPPASINDLTAAPGSDDGKLVLNWTASGDDDMNGTVAIYEIRYASHEINDTNWYNTSLFDNPPAPLNAGELHSVTLAGLNPGQLYYVAIKAYDNVGNNSGMSNLTSAEASINIATDINDTDSELPTHFELAQNYPNPFNPSTSINFSLPENSFVDLTVYNINGQKVTTLVNQNLTAGVHTVEWDGTSTSGNQAATGMYLYRIQTDNYSETKKMVLMK